MTRKKIYTVVTDGQWHKSLSAIRSLGKKEYKVVVLGDSVFTTGFYSRYTSICKKIPEVKTDAELFRAGINQLLNNRLKNNPVVILPMEIDTLFWFAENKTSLEKEIYMSLPSIKQLQIAEDKAKTLKKAIEIEIPCPKTLYSENYNEFLDNLKSIQGEFVIKPYTGSGSKGLLYSDNIHNIDLKLHWKKYGPMLLQERLPAAGKGRGVELLFDNESKCVAFFAHERIHQYPNSGGPSTCCKSIYDNELIKNSVKLLKELKWVGVAMVEWKEDVTDGTYKLMEINPRFWGSLELSARCGINFPELYVRQSLGEQLPVSNILKPEYEIGTMCRWLLPGDILRYITDKNREPIHKFFKGLPVSAEEWNKEDYRGFFASIVCPVLLALNPKYWKYIFKK